MAVIQTHQFPTDSARDRAPIKPLDSGQSRIRVLPNLLVNKIAAGEVVERPASVVKELVENSLDAGATRIAVTIEDGGRQLIRVTDDGIGMTAEDLRFAVMPHATSKITGEEDLYAISTMGFRGEALASISSVSRLRIASRVRGTNEGHEIRVTAEQVESSNAAGCPEGTTVEVRDLFFNVPARRKFLKGASTEVGHINEQVGRIALARPDVSFEVRSNERLTQNLPASATLLERVAKFYGHELAQALLRVERDERGLKIDAFAALPAQSRATAQWQYVYVNGRYIRDRFIQHAIKESYRGLMEPNRHGVVFLFLTIDPALVDVNVHPTKIEVRWADSNLVHSQVLSALREAFQRADLTPTLRTDRAALTPPPEVQERMREELASMLKSQLSGQSPPLFAGRGDESGISTARESWGDQRGVGLPELRTQVPSTGSADPLDVWRRLYGERTEQTNPASDSFAASMGQVLASMPVASTANTAFGPMRPRAIQMHNLYLVVETDEGIMIIDQHALHERVIYEQLRERMTSGTLESQRLLLPETIRVTAQQMSLLEQQADLLRRLGIDASPFGADTVAVHSFPSLLKDTDVPSFMSDLLDYLSQQPSAGQTEVVIHKILDMMACKAAVKAGDPLTHDEIETLVRKRHLVDKATSCPHGRPTILRLTKADLNRQFKRT